MIEFKDAVSKIWQSVKSLKPSQELQEVDIFFDSKDDIPVFIQAMNSGHIISLLESRNAVINLRMKKLGFLEIDDSEIIKVSLVSAAIELSCLSNYSSNHWLRRLMTFAYHTCNQEDQELKNGLLSAFPVALLPEDELANDFYVRAIAQEENHEKRLKELINTPDGEAELKEAVQSIKSLEGTITTTLDCATAFTLVGMLQLAFRHPAVKECETNRVRFFTQGLIDQIGGNFPAVKTHLEKGWHPEYDQ
ncbi:MAG TPA: hypothetical protein V6D21_01930 [Candidatus Obscuribacterales bacterium]